MLGTSGEQQRRRHRQTLEFGTQFVDLDLVVGAQTEVRGLVPHQPHAQRRVGRIAAQGRVEAGSDAVHGRGSPAGVAEAEAGPFGVLLEPAQQRAGDPEHAVGIAHWTSASADRGGAAFLAVATQHLGEHGVQHHDGVVAALLLAGFDLGDLLPRGEIQLAPGQGSEFADAQAGVGQRQVDPAAVHPGDAQNLEVLGAGVRVRTPPLLHRALWRRLYQRVDLLRCQRPVHPGAVGRGQLPGLQHVERVVRPGAAALQVAPERLQRDLVAAHRGGTCWLAWLGLAAGVRRSPWPHFAELQLGEEQFCPRDIQVGEGAGAHLVEREQEAFAFADEVPRVLPLGIGPPDVSVDEGCQQLALAGLERIAQTDLTALHPTLVVDHLGARRVLVRVADELAPPALDLDGVAPPLALVRRALAMLVDRTHERLLLCPPEFVEQVLDDEPHAPSEAQDGPLHGADRDQAAEGSFGNDAECGKF